MTTADRRLRLSMPADTAKHIEVWRANRLALAATQARAELDAAKLALARARAKARAADRVALAAWRLSPALREAVVNAKERSRDAGKITHRARRAG